MRAREINSILGFAFLTVPSLVQAQEPVDYLVRVAEPAAQLYHIEVTLPATGDTTLVSLPAWTPGHYVIEDYARFVQRFAAFSADGLALSWDKVDKDTWRIRSRGTERVRVSYEFHADTISTAGSLLTDDFGYFNGTNLFVYPETGYDFRARVRFQLPEGWRVATELREGNAPGVYYATDFHELVDNPTFVGHFAIDSAVADGVWTRLAIYPARYMDGPGGRMSLEALQKIADYAHELFGGPPYKRYTTFLYLYPGEPRFGGGLEHANSQFDIAPELAMQNAEQMIPQFGYGLYAHEYYHAWNVKRIRPAELWPYRYDREQFTPILWVSEGFTSYYGPVILARSGLWDEEAFWDAMQGQIDNVEGEPIQESVEDVSLTTWARPMFVPGRYYYNKGALIGFLLDIKIRSATGNRHSLDDVMARLYTEHYERDRGFTTEDFLGYVGEYTGADVARDFYSRHIDGREALPYQEVMALAGISYRADTIVEPLLGVGLDYREGRALLQSVVPGSAAAGAGLRPGDQLLRVGVVEVEGQEWGDTFRRTYADSIGSSIEVDVQRNGERVRGWGTLGTRTRIAHQLEPAVGATELQNAVRMGIVTGRTR